MSDLTAFTVHVQDVLRDAVRESHWNPEEAAQYMAEVGVRRERFAALAGHLSQAIIRPRLQVVADLFLNATIPGKTSLSK